MGRVRVEDKGGGLSRGEIRDDTVDPLIDYE